MNSLMDGLEAGVRFVAYTTGVLTALGCAGVILWIVVRAVNFLTKNMPTGQDKWGQK